MLGFWKTVCILGLYHFFVLDTKFFISIASSLVRFHRIGVWYSSALYRHLRVNQNEIKYHLVTGPT